MLDSILYGQGKSLLKQLFEHRQYVRQACGLNLNVKNRDEIQNGEMSAARIPAGRLSPRTMQELA